MRILFTQYGLRHRGGSELFTVEVAGELARRGHEIAIYTGESGAMSTMLEERGIMILNDPAKCPWKPDIIHGQHYEHALRAILAFPATPAILYLHGFMPALEKPFRHPRILRYLTIAESISRHWSSSYEMPADRFVTIPNHIDLDRFHQKSGLPPRPAKALIYAHARFPQEQLKILQNVCVKRGLELELAGLCNGPQGMLRRPEDHLPKYDLVFAVGRSALEASACGCGVIPVYQDMAEEILLPQTFERLRSQNLAPRLLSHQKLSEEWIDVQLNRWNSSLIIEASDMVRKSAGLGRTVSLLEKTYNAVCLEHTTCSTPSWEDERTALEDYFAKGGKHRLMRKLSNLTGKTETLERRIESMTNSFSWKLAAPLRWIDEMSGFSNLRKKY